MFLLKWLVRAHTPHQSIFSWINFNWVVENFKNASLGKLLGVPLAMNENWIFSHHFQFPGVIFAFSYIYFYVSEHLSTRRAMASRIFFPNWIQFGVLCLHLPSSLFVPSSIQRGFACVVVSTTTVAAVTEMYEMKYNLDRSFHRASAGWSHVLHEFGTLILRSACMSKEIIILTLCVSFLFHSVRLFRFLFSCSLHRLSNDNNNNNAFIFGSSHISWLEQTWGWSRARKWCTISMYPFESWRCDKIL